MGPMDEERVAGPAGDPASVAGGNPGSGARSAAETRDGSGAGNAAGGGAQATASAARWHGAIRTRRAIVITVLAIGGLVLSTKYGGLLGDASDRLHLTDRLIAAAGACVFLVFALIAVRGATHDLLQLLPHGFGDARMAALRVICLLTGYALVILGTLSLLHVPWSRLILGGALTGVFLGIAAQPVLGNIFAGLVLLVARPFTVGEKVSVSPAPSVDGSRARSPT